VTRRIALPTVEDVQLVIEDLADATGKPPTVVAVADRFGLANTTFRRSFPDIAAALKQQRATSPASTETAISRFDQLKLDNDKLRRNNHELREHLELAVANIQRLTLENHRLRRQLEASTKVTRIDRNRRPH
jgi:ribosomal protein S12 methylthiotransferase accessory factor YcaO